MTWLQGVLISMRAAWSGGLYKTDFDKPHRCPQCWTVPDGFWNYKKSWPYRAGSARLFWIYKCPYGHRFTKLPLPLRKDPLRRGWRNRGR